MVIILLEADDRWGWLTVEAGVGDTDVECWWRTEVEKILEADNDDDPDIGRQW